MSVSGKFKTKPTVSNYVGDTEDTQTIAAQIPALPGNKNDNAISVFLTEYFGQFWWLWLIVVLIIKNNRI